MRDGVKTPMGMQATALDKRVAPRPQIRFRFSSGKNEAGRAHCP
jgi:hypothetical protein